MKKSKCFIITLLIFSIFLGTAAPLYSEENSALPYDQQEFPQFLKDFRRFEIITLGAMPFVTLDTTLVYSTYRYIESGYDSDYKPNLFGASTYSQEEQKNIILTSVGVCLCIGLTDYIVQLIKRAKIKKARNLLNSEEISIYTLSEDPDAVPIPRPDENEDDDVISVVDDEDIEVVE